MMMSVIATSIKGLTNEQVLLSRRTYGRNEYDYKKRIPCTECIKKHSKRTNDLVIVRCFPYLFSRGELVKRFLYSVLVVPVISLC
ncbi:cation-transporting P-type ATPase [Cytophaga aurantiaca]|uniref:cation-transporting P-type ATPase n=1 Tax=Cytophaga aurantiaca TaxID=29530 RepID=UPI0004760CDC